MIQEYTFEDILKLDSLKQYGQALQENASFFLIRAPTRDNVHRAIKYGIWTSSSRNNQKLNEAQRPVYLLFNVIQVSAFIGLAKLTSEFREKEHFKYWSEENKWFGTFNIEWVSNQFYKIFIKDVPYIDLAKIPQSSGKAIHELIDCTQIENGEQVYEIFKNAPQNTTLLRFFKDLDHSEQKKRNERDNNPNFQQQFLEYIEVFESMPFSFSVASYQRRKQQQQQLAYYNQMQYYYQTPYGGVAQPGFWTNPQAQTQTQQQFYKQPTQQRSTKKLQKKE